MSLKPDKKSDLNADRYGRNVNGTTVFSSNP